MSGCSPAHCGPGTGCGSARRGAGQTGTGKVTAISVFDRGPGAARDQVTAGQIGKLWGLGGIQAGDSLGARDVIGPAAGERLPEAGERGPVAGERGPVAGERGPVAGERGPVAGERGPAAGERGPVAGEHRAAPQERRFFAPPTLETVIVPGRPADKGALRAALGLLAEQDPLINVRQDDIHQEILVSLYGEVQKEVIQATLAADFGIDVAFRESTTLCIERPRRTGAAAEFMSDDANPFRATAGLRIEPAAAGSGVRFQLGIEAGALPAAFQKAVEETVRETLHEGLSGWPVTDAVVTLTHSGYTPPPPFGWSKWSTSAADFRHLTPLVLMTALRRAGTAGVRAHPPVQPGHPGGHVRAGAALAGPAGRSARGVAAARFVLPGRGGHPGRPGARTGTATARADPWRGSAGLRVRPLPGGARPGPRPAAFRPQPAEQEGVPAAREAAGRRAARQQRRVI